MLSADAATDSRFEMSQSIADFRIRSMMCAPLVTGDGNVLGVIQIDTLDQRARFTNDDVEVLASVAAQAAFAVDNAQLHERQLKQQAIQADLDAARKVQHVLLPAAPPVMDDYQFFDFYEPANQVGGDFYDYIALRDGRVAVVLADVSGKGVAAALVMAKISAEVRYFLASEPTAAEAVEKINESFCRAGWEDRFATFVLALLDPAQNRVTIVNAGHMPPFVRLADRCVKELAPEISGLPLGVAEGIPYESAEVALAPGEMITLFTDGISEALNPANELYTLEHLQKQLGLPADNAATLGRIVLDDVKRHAAGRCRATICAWWFSAGMRNVWRVPLCRLRVVARLFIRCEAVRAFRPTAPAAVRPRLIGCLRSGAPSRGGLGSRSRPPCLPIDRIRRSR